MAETMEYRLSWESISFQQAAGMEDSYGRGVWPKLHPNKWDALDWQEPTVKIDTDPWAQFNTLRRWAETHEQPIRNVRLEQRIAPSPDEGWTAVLERGEQR